MKKSNEVYRFNTRITDLTGIKIRNADIVMTKRREPQLFLIRIIYLTGNDIDNRHARFNVLRNVKLH